MATATQINPYKGRPPRSWIRVRLVHPNGAAVDADLLADTGNPFALVISEGTMARVKDGDAPDVRTNFGVLHGAWVHVAIPELGLQQAIMGYASDAVSKAAKASDIDFEGLAGLPLLRLMEYGGNADSFWLKRPRSPKKRRPASRG